MVLPLVPLAGTAAVGSLAGASGGIGAALGAIGGAAGGVLSGLGGFVKDFGGPIGDFLGGLGGLFGGGGKPKRVNSLLQLRKDAEKAGFNPLTALLATGGGAGYGVGPAMPSFLSLAAGLIGPSLSQAFEHAEDRKNDEIARALMAAQTRNIELQNIRLSEPVEGSVWMDGALMNFPALTGASFGGGSSRAQGTGALDGPLAVVPDAEATAPVVFGRHVKANPNFSDAEVLETRYGEVGGLLGGVFNMGADAWQSLPSFGDLLGGLRHTPSGAGGTARF